MIRPPGMDDADRPPEFGEGISLVRPPAGGDSDRPPDFGQGTKAVDPVPNSPRGGGGTGERPRDRTAIGRRPPAGSTAPESQPPRGPITVNEPLYAVYGIHAWSVPVVPEGIQRTARSRDGRYTASLSSWIDSLTARAVWPADQATSFLAFQVSGEMLEQYRAHLNAGNAGEGGRDYWLFRDGGRYHQTFTIIAPTGQRFQAPLFLKFQALFSGGKPPEKFCLARIQLLGTTVDLRATPPLNNKRAPGGGWQFSDNLKVHYVAGPIEYDGDTRWSDATHRLALEHAKQVLRFSVQVGIGIGEAVGDAIGEALGGGSF